MPKTEFQLFLNDMFLKIYRELSDLEINVMYSDFQRGFPNRLGHLTAEVAYLGSTNNFTISSEVVSLVHESMCQSFKQAYEEKKFDDNIVEAAGR